MSDIFARSLQENLLTLLVHSEAHGKIISKVIPVNLFEGDYRLIGERALAYWQQYDQPPKLHIADLLADILEDSHDRRGQTYRRILVQMFEMKDQINPDYALRSMQDFIGVQSWKGNLIEVAEFLDARGVNGLEEFKGKLRNLLNEKDVNLDLGLRLNEYDKVLDFLSNVQNEFDTGIKELDAGHIVPMRGKLMLLIAPKKRGKTHFLIHIGKRAFLRRKRVCHITLEIEEEEVAQRYYQSLFGASKRDDLNKISTFRFDSNENLDQIVSQTVEVPFTFASQAIREELQTRIGHFGTRISNVVIKRFPMSSLTLNQLEAYLEGLETTEKFIPDMVIIDYPKIMKLDKRDVRISLGLLFEELRGMAQRRNFALVVVHQGNRESDSAEFVKGSHVAEDWSILGTCDFALTLSRTSAEKRMNLARLFVDAARSEADSFGVLITQSYQTGQFVLESTRLSDSYTRLMESMGTGDDADDNNEE